jgi:hypothetical protein
MTKNDFLRIVSITDCQKTQLGENFQPMAIQNDYRKSLNEKVSISCNQVASNRFSIVLEEFDHKFKDKKTQICYLSRKLNASYLFIGSFGRKGEQ